MKFQQAELLIPTNKDTITLLPGESIIYIEDKPYLQWHDLIDIRVPLFNDPSILLTKRVISPLHGVNPRSILTQIDKDWWNRTRKRVYESSGNFCRCCRTHKSFQRGYPKNIDAHELYDVNYETGESTLKCIVPLCSSMCHQGVHFGRLTAQRDSGKIQEKTFYSIISYCNSVLKEAGLPRKNWNAEVNDNTNNIPWSQWHLTLNINGERKEFYSLYKNEDELNAAYS